MRYAFLSIAAILTCPLFAQDESKISIKTVTLDPVRPARYARSFMDGNRDIHVMGLFKVTKLKDGELLTRAQSDPVFPATALNESEMNTFFSTPGMFMAFNNRLEPVSGSTYTCKMWRSDDDLKTIKEEQAIFILPEAGKVDFGTPEEWAGLFCHRAIIQLEDGSLLMSLYGNFQSDTIKPTNPQSKVETKYKLRAFVATSTDQGYTWHYLSSVAVPVSGHTDNSEGFNEWSMVQLNDGRILAVVRTGHFTPFVTSISTDQGHTWSKPEPVPEFGPGGCDPYLLKLDDGRIAISWGEMVQPPKGDSHYFEDFSKRGDTRRRSRLAISETPDARRWHTIEVTDYDRRSAYSTIFQVGRNRLLYQTDLELYDILIPDSNK